MPSEPVQRCHLTQGIFLLQYLLKLTGSYVDQLKFCNLDQLYPLPAYIPLKNLALQICFSHAIISGKAPISRFHIRQCLHRVSFSGHHVKKTETFVFSTLDQTHESQVKFYFYRIYVDL